MMARRAYPIPEVINRKGAPRQFKVRQVAKGETPQAAAGTGEMIVPIDDSVGSTWVRRHEMAHIKWSPLRGPRSGSPDAPFLFACEDARVNQLIARAHLNTQTGRTPPEIRVHLMPLAPVDAMLVRVAMAGTSDEAPAATWLYERDPELAKIANTGMRMMRSGLDHYVTTKRVAQYLREQVEKLGKKASPVKMPPPPMAPPVGGKQSGEGDAGGGSTGGGMLGSVSVSTYKPGDRTPLPTIWRAPERGSRTWGKMTVLTPPLRQRLPRAVGHGKWRPADAGAVPRRMERWTSDQAVFSTRGRQRSGTVLIDASGSMSLSADQILDCVLKAPAATVAMYCGAGLTGELTILAQRGRRVDKIPGRDSGNVIDGPALRWLATQKSPRIWVCDEVVTGINDVAADSLRTEAQGICRSFGIMRVETLEQAAKVLGGRHIIKEERQ